MVWHALRTSFNFASMASTATPSGFSSAADMVWESCFNPAFPLLFSRRRQKKILKMSSALIKKKRGGGLKGRKKPGLTLNLSAAPVEEYVNCCHAHCHWWRHAMQIPYYFNSLPFLILIFFRDHS